MPRQNTMNTIGQAIENYINGNLAEAKRVLRRNPLASRRIACEKLGAEHGQALVLWALGAMDWKELCDVAAKGAAR